MRLSLFVIAIVFTMATASASAADNQLTPEERAKGWILLFDGSTNWKTSRLEPSQTPIENASLNPHKCGAYMLVHEGQWSDFILKIDFKISKGCNSGIFFRTYPLTPGNDDGVGLRGLEMAVDDTTTAGYHDTGAIYDLAKPVQNAMKPAGKWNRAEITCDDNIVIVVLNGQTVSWMDLDDFPEAHRRPDGTRHKFNRSWKDHPRKGYIGLQDHGRPCWYKNIKVLPLKRG